MAIYLWDQLLTPVGGGGASTSNLAEQIWVYSIYYKWFNSIEQIYSSTNITPGEYSKVNGVPVHLVGCVYPGSILGWSWLQSNNLSSRINGDAIKKISLWLPIYKSGSIKSIGIPIVSNGLNSLNGVMLYIKKYQSPSQHSTLVSVNLKEYANFHNIMRASTGSTSMFYRDFTEEISVQKGDVVVVELDNTIAGHSNYYVGFSYSIFA